jgi:hypothetical protein
MNMSETKKQIVLGRVYSVAVGGSFLPVRADKSLGHGRYEGRTMRPDGPGSAVKFTTDRVRGDGAPEAEWRAKRAAKPVEQPTPPVQKAGTKAAKTKTPAKERKLSGLDAAAQVLADAKEPLNTAEMVKRMLERGLWKTNGKTPAATIYAAIIREISVKGNQSRFRKTERGKFTLAK